MWASTLYIWSIFTCYACKHVTIYHVVSHTNGWISLFCYCSLVRLSGILSFYLRRSQQVNNSYFSSSSFCQLSSNVYIWSKKKCDQLVLDVTSCWQVTSFCQMWPDVARCDQWFQVWQTVAMCNHVTSFQVWPTGFRYDQVVKVVTSFYHLPQGVTSWSHLHFLKQSANNENFWAQGPVKL